MVMHYRYFTHDPHVMYHYQLASNHISGLSRRIVELKSIVYCECFEVHFEVAVRHTEQFLA